MRAQPAEMARNESAPDSLESAVSWVASEFQYASVPLDTTIVPKIGDQNVYLVLDCSERSGCAWREAEPVKRTSRLSSVT